MKIFLPVLLILSGFFGKSQILESESCGNSARFQLRFPQLVKEPWHNNNAFLDSFLSATNMSPEAEKISYRIPIQLMVHRTRKQSGGVSEAEIKEKVNYLNYYYSINATGIRFYMQPDIIYIDNNRLASVHYIRQTMAASRKKNKKYCINIHLVNNLAFYQFGKVKKSYYGVHNHLTHGIIVRNNTATATLAHEVGHYLGLDHPHKFYRRGKGKQEPVSRTRKKGKHLLCETNGDKLSDTPAQPDLSGYTDRNCEFTGNLRDNWGEFYDPDTDNIMSYGKYRECRTQFTPQQKAVMHYTISKNKYADKWSANRRGSEDYKFDISEPDDTREMATEIFFNTPQLHTFHKIYQGKRFVNADDKVDYLFFKVKSTTKRALTVKIMPGNMRMADIDLTVYENNKVIKTERIRSGKTTEITVDVKQGRYYIALENKNPGDRITDYKIEVIRK